jgi:hypothetical protein
MERVRISFKPARTLSIGMGAALACCCALACSEGRSTIAAHEQPGAAGKGATEVKRLDLMNAILAGDEAGALAALESGADPNAADSSGLSALNYASAFGMRRLAESLLVAGASIDYRDPWGMTSLHAALKEGHDDVALLLLAKGAGVSYKTTAGSYPGFTALHTAAFFGAVRLDTVRALLAAGADPLATDSSGQTPIDMAQSRGDGELARLLRAHAGK